MKVGLKRGGRGSLVLVASALGSAFKISGGLIYGSKSVLVDALTSVANATSLAAVYYYTGRAFEPSDADHHYGHARQTLSGVLITLVAYGFVAGLCVGEVSSYGPYTVSPMASLFALLGVLMYGLAILCSKELGGAYSVYGEFTISELLEGAATVGTSLAGALYSYIVDYAGALALTGFLFFELAKQTAGAARLISDIAPNREVVENVIKEFELRGLAVSSARLRVVIPGLYHGDVVVKVPPNTSLEKALEAIGEAKRSLATKYNAIVVVEIERSR